MYICRKALFVLVVVLAVHALSACSGLGKDAPPREEVQALLEEEAKSMKQEGEQVDPSLGVKITWEIQSIEVREQPEDDLYPWAGTIRYVIKSEAKEYDGSTETEQFEKAFEYVWDTATERWIVN
jgi:hypothetical protein